MAPAALLIGAITHARKEWEGLSSLLTLKVCIFYRILSMDTNEIGIPLWHSGEVYPELQEWRV